MASGTRGYFVWHELMSTDPSAAIPFYRKVAGWTAQAWPADPSYRIWEIKSRQIGGLMDLPDEARRGGAPSSWLPYIGTEDAEVAAWEAQRLGGKVIRDTAAVPTVGKFAVLQDPQGAVFAVLEHEEERAVRWPPDEGDFSWHELMTSDPDNAFRFYSALFGWQKVDSFDMGPDGLYQMFGWKNRMLGGVYRRPASVTAPPHWTSYVNVPDAIGAARKAEQMGARIVTGPMEVPGGDWVAVGIDLQGAEFAVHSAPRAAKGSTARKPAGKKATKKPMKKAAKKAARQAVKRKTSKRKPAARKAGSRTSTRKKARRR
jgi:predicted enzyme related to lactoylglutathione lyase